MCVGEKGEWHVKCIAIGNPRWDWIYGLGSRIHQHWFQHCETLLGGSNAGGQNEIAMVLAAVQEACQNSEDWWWSWL